jgi:hypothetical protein
MAETGTYLMNVRFCVAGEEAMTAKGKPEDGPIGVGRYR